MRKNNLFGNLTPLGLVFLAACKGTTTSTFIANSTGRVEDGPLLNAIAFLDYNNNGILDGNEPFDRTASDGSYSLTPTQENYSIVAVTDDLTIDTVSGSVLSGVTLKAPSNSSMVTPTTTLMEDGDLTAEQVVDVLGLPADMNPLTFSAHAAGVDPAKALAVEKANQQILNVVNSFAAAAEGSGVGALAAFEAALKSLAEQIKVKAAAKEKLDLANSVELTAIQSKIEAKVVALSNAEIAAGETLNIRPTEFALTMTETVKATGFVNGKIKAITDTNLKSAATKDILSTSKVLRDQVNAAAKDLVNGGAGTIIFANADGVALEASITNKAPTEIALDVSAISEAAASPWVVGTLSTTDTDEAVGAVFKYAIAKATGTDHAAFSIDATTGVLSLIAQPDYETKSEYNITVRSQDAGGKAFSKAMTVSVEDTNDAPTVANAMADQIIVEGGSLNFQFNANVFLDVDKTDSLSFTATLSDGSALPSWLTFDADTRTFTGTPSSSDTGGIKINVTATDTSNATVSDTFYVTFGDQSAVSISKTVVGDTTKVSLYLNEYSSEAVDGVGSFAIDLDYEESIVSFSESDLTFAAGVTGLLGAHDTSTGNLTIGGYALADFTNFETPILEFDLVAVSAPADLSLKFSNILIDDFAFEDQTLLLDIV
tara:strand:+ start:195 stop:2168 length:1974 start_codon:yes stop_codon:yes gene_type:complete